MKRRGKIHRGSDEASQSSTGTLPLTLVRIKTKEKQNEKDRRPRRKPEVERRVCKMETRLKKNNERVRSPFLLRGRSVFSLWAWVYTIDLRVFTNRDLSVVYFNITYISCSAARYSYADCLSALQYKSRLYFIVHSILLSITLTLIMSILCMQSLQLGFILLRTVCLLSSITVKPHKRNYTASLYVSVIFNNYSWLMEIFVYRYNYTVDLLLDCD